MDIIGSIDDEIRIIDKTIDKINKIVSFAFRFTFFNTKKPIKKASFCFMNNTFVSPIGNNVEEFVGSKKYIATANVDGTEINSFDSLITFNDRPSRANNCPIKYSIWFAKMKQTSKKILILDSKEIISNYIFSTGFQGLKVNEKALCYLWAFICTKEFEEIKDKMSSGATQQAVDMTTLERLSIPCPEDIRVLGKFNNIILPLLKQSETIHNQKNVLSTYKKFLLPLLLNEQVI